MLPGPKYEEAVISESGIFLVSIPRLSMQTGPGTGSKPVYNNKKREEAQLDCKITSTQRCNFYLFILVKF